MTKKVDTAETMVVATLPKREKRAKKPMQISTMVEMRATR